MVMVYLQDTATRFSVGSYSSNKKLPLRNGISKEPQNFLDLQKSLLGMLVTLGDDKMS